VVPVLWFRSIDPAVQATIAPGTQAARVYFTHSPGKGTASAVPSGPLNERALTTDGTISDQNAVHESSKLSKVIGH
jgi:hypothetical protein